MPRRVKYDPRHDYYEVIGVSPEEDGDAIQRAYRQRAKELHPDVNPERIEWAKEQFQLLNDAYSILSDPVLRREYNELRYVQRIPPPPSQFTPPSASFSYADYISKDYVGSTGRVTPRPSSSVWQSRRKNIRVPGLWLHNYKLGWLRPYYGALVNLANSPYRYVLAFIGMALVVQSVVLIGVGLSNSDGVSEKERTQNVDEAQPVVGGQIPNATVVASVTPSVSQCSDSLTIYTPRNGITVYDGMVYSIVATAKDGNIVSYSLSLAGENTPAQKIPLELTNPALRAPFIQKEIGNLSALNGRPAGQYRLTLTAQYADGHIIKCEVVFSKEN